MNWTIDNYQIENIIVIRLHQERSNKLDNKFAVYRIIYVKSIVLKYSLYPSYSCVSK